MTHPLKKFPKYVALMSSIIDVEPSRYEEAIGEKVWHDAMVEGYNSILRNYVWGDSTKQCHMVWVRVQVRQR